VNAQQSLPLFHSTLVTYSQDVGKQTHASVQASIILYYIYGRRSPNLICSPHAILSNLLHITLIVSVSETDLVVYNHLLIPLGSCSIIYCNILCCTHIQHVSTCYKYNCTLYIENAGAYPALRWRGRWSTDASHDLC